MSDLRTQAQGALEPPRGVTPDFVHPSSLDRFILPIQIVFLTLIALCVLMRMYTCLFILRRFGVEEYTCLASWPLATAYSALILETARHGGGIHQWNVRKEEIAPYLKFIIAGELVYAVLVFLVKATILLLYQRIFGVNRKVKWTIRVLLCILFAYYLASIVAKSATCVPLRKLWIPGLDGHCFNNTILLLTDCGVSIVSDFAILVIPIPLIWDLHIPIRRKMELTTVFGLGVFACVSSVMRTYYTSIGVYQHDSTYDYVRVWLWTIPEVNCGLICGCIPILPALFQHLRDKQLSTGQDTARKGRFHTLTNYTGRRPPGTERLNTSDIELDEAGLLGHAALNSMKTSVTKGSSDGLKIGSTLHHDQILKKIDIQQTSVKKAREDLG